MFVLLKKRNFEVTFIIEKGKERGAVDYIIKSNTIPSKILKKVENILKNR